MRQSRRWDPDRGTYADGRQRNADVFVFALLSETDRARIDPLDVAQWQFYVLSRRTIESRAGNAQTLSLKRLTQLGAEISDFPSLRAVVERAHVPSSSS